MSDVGRRWGMLAPLLLAGVVAAVFGPSLGHEFVWDDHPLIERNALVQEPGHLVTVLTSSFWDTGDSYDRFRAFFRPLVSASYVADHALWGLRPAGFHATNLLLHGLACWLVYALARRERLLPAAALVGAAWFAVHPVHVESVSWISGRTDLLCAVFLLAAFAVHRGAAAGDRWRLRVPLVVLLFACALFAKEMAATFPALVFLDRWLRPGCTGGAGAGRNGAPSERPVAGAARAALPYVLVLVVYLALRQAALLYGSIRLFSMDAESYAATSVFVLARYLVLLLVPVGLDAHYPYAPFPTLLSPTVMLAAAFVAAVLGSLLWLARRSRPAAFWSGWLLLSLAPVFNFGTFGDVVMADRFLYIPSVGVAMLLAHGARWYLADRPRPLARRLVAAGAAAVLVLLAAQAARRSSVWKDDLTLFSDMATTSPDSPLVRANLGMALYAAGDYAAAKRSFSSSLMLAPDYSLAHNNLAAVLEREGRSGEAIRHYRHALRVAPMQYQTRTNLGGLLARTGRPEVGERLLRQVLDAHPRYAPAHYALAEALYHAGRPAEALAQADSALDADPSMANPYFLRATIRLEQGRNAEAAAALRRFLRLWPLDDAYRRRARDLITAAENAAGTRILPLPPVRGAH